VNKRWHFRPALIDRHRQLPDQRGVERAQLQQARLVALLHVALQRQRRSRLPANGNSGNRGFCTQNSAFTGHSEYPIRNKEALRFLTRERLGGTYQRGANVVYRGSRGNSVKRRVAERTEAGQEFPKVLHGQEPQCVLLMSRAKSKIVNHSL
jgi:hypothetical protein